MQWLSQCFFSWRINEWRGWCGSSLHFISSLKKISCYLHKQLIPENSRTCPSCINIENSDNGKVTTWKSLVLKSCSILDFHSEYYIPDIKKLGFNLLHVYIPGKIILQVNAIACLWVKTISLTVNLHVIMNKYARYSANKFTHNNYLVVSKFLLT